MRLSDKRKSALYEVIYDSLMEARIDCMKKVAPHELQVDIDQRLYKLESEIWLKVCKVLEIDNP